MAAYYSTDDLDFIVGLFGFLITLLFLILLLQSFLQFRDPKFIQKVAKPILICGYTSMVLFMICAMNLSIERMLLASYDYTQLSEPTLRSVAESTYIWGKLFLYLLFLARLHYSFQALPHLDYKKEIKITFVVISLSLAAFFWIASLYVNWGNDVNFQTNYFEPLALTYYVLDAVFTIFALYLFNNKLNDLVTSKENLKRQLTTQANQNELSAEEITSRKKIDARSEKLVDTMVRYTVLVIVAVATSWVIALNFILVVGGAWAGADAYFFKQGTLLIVDTLVNFICVWLNFKFSSQSYEYLCECRCPNCSKCDFHGCIKKWYFERNGFEYVDRSVALKAKKQQEKDKKKQQNVDTRSDAVNEDTESNLDIKTRDDRAGAVSAGSGATEISVASSVTSGPGSRWLD